MFEGLVEYYDKLEERGEKVCPVAHTYLSCHIGVLLDKNGGFLCAKIPDVSAELIPVPCTIQSGARTSGPAPHLLSDNLAYVAKMNGYKERHKLYIDQLKEYVESVPEDEYAQSIYKYTKSGTILNDLKDILPKIKKLPQYKINIIFCVYGLPNEGSDLLWTKYYLPKLPKNGICCVTGARDYIPSAYPAGILSPSGNERLFLDDAPVGYIASQKIIHVLQYMLYGQKNADRVEAEYHIKRYMQGSETEENFINWIEGKYQGHSENVIKIIRGETNE